MKVTIELTPENEAMLGAKAEKFGMLIPAFVEHLLRPHMTPPRSLDHIVKPLHDAFESGDVGQVEMVELIHKIRRDLATERLAESL